MSADATIPVDTAIADAGYTPPTFGDVSEIHEALDFDNIEDLAPDTRVPAKVDGTDAVAKPKAEKTAVDDDVAELKAIEARAKERRKARNATRAKAEATAAPAAKPIEVAPVAKATVTLSPVEQAVKDTIAAIERLAAGDAEAAAANDGAPAADTARRNAQMAAITAK